MSAKKAAKKTTAKKLAKKASPNKNQKTKEPKLTKVPENPPATPKKLKHNTRKNKEALNQIDAAIDAEFDKTSVRVRVLFKEIVIPIFISLSKKFGPAVLDEVLHVAIRSTKNTYAKTIMTVLSKAIRSAPKNEP